MSISKIAIITDTHFGTRKNSKYFMRVQEKFYKERFFPYLEENNIRMILHLGDFFDNRKTVNFETLQHAKNCFIHHIQEQGIILHMLVGNHDSYFKSNGDLTSTKLLFNDHPNITIHDSVSTWEFGNYNFLLVPWIFPIQKEEITEVIRLSTADVCCGHFEMVGVVQEGTSISRKGLDTGIFSHFDYVYSGHFHKKSQYYVGAPYQMKWSDYDDPKRFIVFDPNTGDEESVYLADDVYMKVNYPLDDGQDSHYLSTCEEKIIRVLVKRKDDPVEFEKFIKKIEDFNPHEIDIKEEHLYIDTMQGDIDDDTDTLSILLSSVDEIEELSKGDKYVVGTIMKKLYEKANE